MLVEILCQEKNHDSKNVTSATAEGFVLNKQLLKVTDVLFCGRCVFLHSLVHPGWIRQHIPSHSLAFASQLSYCFLIF